MLPQVSAINASKQVVTDEIEAFRVALGADVTTKQLQRTIHAFDGAPRRSKFTWGGHTISNEQVPVATAREQLQAHDESRAQRQGLPIEHTPDYQDLRTLGKFADDKVLIKHNRTRCTLWFGERGEK